MQNKPLSYVDVEPQSEYTIIPNNTLAKVRIYIKAGNYNDETKGWTGNLATRNSNTGSIYLRMEFTVIEGEHAQRKVWSNVGLYSPSSEKFGKIGNSFIRSILDSANGLDSKDKSAAANCLRELDSLADLNGVEFIAKIEVETDNQGKERNNIRFAVTKGHKDYERLMGKVSKDNGRFKLSGKKKEEPQTAIVDDVLPF